MNGWDHLATVHHLRDLAGPRPNEELIAGMHCGAQRLESLIGQWQTFPPRASTITDAEAIVEGLRRGLCELRSQEADPDAA